MNAHPANFPRRQAGFTMLELIIVVLIVSLLAALSFPVIAKMKRSAVEAATISNLRQVSAATMVWAAEHGDKLPSPQYEGSETDLPRYWNLDTDGEQGLWLNGVVFAQIYVEDDQDEDGPPPSVGGATNLADTGKHLVGTVFESKISVARDASERDWYRHSFAMNSNLEYDELAVLRGLPDPYFSEKSVSKFDPAKAMLYIDCSETNVVDFDDIASIEETAEERYDGRRVMVAFLDGRVQKMDPDEIPQEGLDSDRETSLFWRGVLPED